jgi:hypothetical protein
MNISYVIKEIVQTQTGMEKSFCGGKPIIPSGMDLPICGLCGVEQTFFFQVEFPIDHFWHGFSMALFQCTSCVDANHLIPEIAVYDSNRSIPKDFLENIRLNYAIFVFKTTDGKIIESYSEKILFRNWKLHKKKPSKKNIFIDGEPIWIMEDETPFSYENQKMGFLMQIPKDHDFETKDNAPRQRKISFIRSKPGYIEESIYRLFIGNACYFFGNETPNNPRIYVLVQK